MKKIITGASLLITGAILFLSSFVAASGMGLYGGWNHNGRFYNALAENKLTPVLVISILIMLAGVITLIIGNLQKSE